MTNLYEIRPLEWREIPGCDGLWARTAHGPEAHIGEIDGKVALWWPGKTAFKPRTIERAKEMAQELHDAELIRRFLKPAGKQAVETEGD